MTHFDPPNVEIQSVQQHYYSILLRYWREDETAVWRYVAQDLATGEHYSFANMDLLIAFLYQRMERQVL